MEASELDRIAESHAEAAGDLCVDGDGDGCCDLCGVALAVCDECGGRGYHRDTCDTTHDEPFDARGPRLPTEAR